MGNEKRILKLGGRPIGWGWVEISGGQDPKVTKILVHSSHVDQEQGVHLGVTDRDLNIELPTKPGWYKVSMEDGIIYRLRAGGWMCWGSDDGIPPWVVTHAELEAFLNRNGKRLVRI